MNRTLLTLAAVLATTLATGGAASAQSGKPVAALAAFPAALKLKGTDDAPQLLVTGKLADGREVDLTASATYSVSDPKVLRVEPTGRVVPLANGSAEITATVEGKTVKVPVVAEKMEAPL